MRRMVQTIVMSFGALMLLAGNGFGGWLSFEPNLILRDGTPVARYLDDIKEETAYLNQGDTAKADELIKDQRVYRIKEGQDMTRVEFKGYEESQGAVFIQVKDESGTKVWADMKGLACVDQTGKTKELTKEDVIKGAFSPLP